MFWRNNVINAWCISKIVGNDTYCTSDGFWIGIYDEDAPAYAGKFRFSFTSYGGMCGYDFTKFFDFEQIDNEMDLRIQEKFMVVINKLIDKKIIVKLKAKKSVNA